MKDKQQLAQQSIWSLHLSKLSHGSRHIHVQDHPKLQSAANKEEKAKPMKQI